MTDTLPQIRPAGIGDVPNDWTVAPLSAFSSRITYGFTNPMPETQDGPFLVTAKDIQGGKVDYSTARHTSWDAYRSNLTDKSRPRIDDVLLTKDGSIGRVALCDRGSVCINQSVAAIRPNDRIVPRFLKYLLEAPYYQDRMESDADGSTIKHIYITRVDKMEIAVPRMQEQAEIVRVLTSLDDKIDLNRQTNETLEAMARAIFKDWFVDFGPTRAKMAGHVPYLAPELWALFPDRLDGKGKPEGWPVGRLDDLVVLQRGFDLPNAERVAGEYAVIAASGFNGTHDKFMVSGPGVTTGRSGVLGQVFFIHEDFWPLNTSLWVKEFPRSSPAHAYFLLQGLDFASFNAGSAVPTLNRNHVHNLPQVVPTWDVIRAFDRLVVPLLQRQRANEIESRTLAQTRDLLLPKLMSGEIRIKEAEKAVAELV